MFVLLHQTHHRPQGQIKSKMHHSFHGNLTSCLKQVLDTRMYAQLELHKRRLLDGLGLQKLQPLGTFRVLVQELWTGPKCKSQHHWLPEEGQCLLLLPGVFSLCLYELAMLINRHPRYLERTVWSPATQITEERMILTGETEMRRDGSSLVRKSRHPESKWEKELLYDKVEF